MLNRRLDNPVVRQALRHLYRLRRMLESHRPAQGLDREHESRVLRKGAVVTIRQAPHIMLMLDHEILGMRAPEPKWRRADSRHSLRHGMIIATQS